MISMEIREIRDEKYREKWNKIAEHPLQAWEWGQFRAKTGVRVARYAILEGDKLSQVVQITIHPIPHSPWNIGYYPKGSEITKDIVEVLKRAAETYKCVYIKCEPKVECSESRDMNYELWRKQFKPGRSLFTKYNFVLDVSPSEDELLKNMKQKTRYNIKVASKRGVTVQIDNSNQAFERYLQLTEETTERQGFYAHSKEYHRKMWETLHEAGIAELLTAKYEGQIITTWVLFQFGDTLYYPYGASTREYREVMANNLVMWEAIKLAKSRGLKYLDMWGALGPEADPKDPWYGFHTFKQGYGARHVEYIGTLDYVAKPILYGLVVTADNWRWKLLRLFKH